MVSMSLEEPPMQQILEARTRGRTRISWLDSAHSFSFGNYHDPARMGFRVLRVVNDDRVAPAGGFAPHSHRDMEIVSYVVSGALEHKDSLGNGSRIVPGDVQLMSAGTGITHSEFNGSKAEPVRFLQIWIPPSQRGLTPSYAQQNFAAAERGGRLRLVVSPDAADGSLLIHQDAQIYAGSFDGDQRAELELSPGRHAWVQVVRGRLTANGASLGEGDGLALSEEARVQLSSGVDAEVLVFDLP